MIRYALACDRGHVFDSWFPSSEAYDEQRARGLVTCPHCGSARIDKQLMAPAVKSPKRRKTPVVIDQEGRAAAPSPQAHVPERLMTPEMQAMRAMIRAFREHVIAHSEDVGDRFAKEVRRIHEGEAEERGVRGEATPEEVRELLDDGIAVMPLPTLPEDLT